MKLSYFLEIFLQQSYMQVCVKTLKNHERMELCNGQTMFIILNSA